MPGTCVSAENIPLFCFRKSTCTSIRARSGVWKLPGFIEVIMCLLCQPLSSRPGVQQESAQGVGKKEICWNFWNFSSLQLAETFSRASKCQQIPEQTHFLQPFSGSGMTENWSRTSSSSHSKNEYPYTSAATTTAQEEAHAVLGLSGPANLSPFLDAMSKPTRENPVLDFGECISREYEFSHFQRTWIFPVVTLS